MHISVIMSLGKHNFSFFIHSRKPKTLQCWILSYLGMFLYGKYFSLKMIKKFNFWYYWIMEKKQVSCSDPNSRENVGRNQTGVRLRRSFWRCSNAIRMKVSVLFITVNNTWIHYNKTEITELVYQQVFWISMVLFTSINLIRVKIITSADYVKLLDRFVADLKLKWLHLARKTVLIHQDKASDHNCTVAMANLH